MTKQAAPQSELLCWALKGSRLVMRLYPALRDYKILEFWWGFRPNTPDEVPILGESNFDNLTLATGHYRNGILLAPVTAMLIADLIWNNQSDPLLAAFNYSRFMEAGSKV